MKFAVLLSASAAVETGAGDRKEWRSTCTKLFLLLLLRLLLLLILISALAAISTSPSTASSSKWSSSQIRDTSPSKNSILLTGSSVSSQFWQLNWRLNLLNFSYLIVFWWQETLVDLLGVACRHSSLPIVVCCSSRDELDAVCSAVSNLSFISLSPLVIFPFRI